MCEKRGKRPGRHRLAVDIPAELHRALKNLALKHNMTITKFVIRALIERIKLEI